MVLDKVAAAFNFFAHQKPECFIGNECIFQFDFTQTAGFGILRRIPQLAGVHFTQTFVALDGLSFGRFKQQPVNRFVKTVGLLGRIF